MTKRLELMRDEDRRVQSHLQKKVELVARALRRYAKVRGVGTEDCEAVAEVAVQALRFDLRGPVAGQMLLVDRDDETGRLSNPRLVEAGPAEELLYPEGEDGEPREEAVASMVVGLPLLGWLPEVG